MLRASLLLLCLVSVLVPMAASGQDRDLPEVVRELLDSARRSRAGGRPAEAEESYREALRRGPGVEDSYLGLGALYHEQGRLEEALETYERGIREVGEERDLLFNAAVVALALDRPEVALVHLEKAVRAFPREADLHRFIGTTLRRLGRAEEARQALERGLKLAPKDPRLHFALGNVLHQLDLREDAIEAFRQSIRRDPKQLRAHYNLGAVLFELERYREAQAAYEVALAPLDEALKKGGEVEAIHAQAYRNLGIVFVQQEEWQKAAEALAKAVALDPTSAPGHYQRGYSLYRGGRLPEARQSYQRALELDPELPVAHLHLAEMDAGAGDCPAALGHLEGALDGLSEDDDRRRGLWLRADCAQRTGDLLAAEDSLRRLLELHGDHRPALLALGRLLRRGERPAEARSFLERALAADPGDVAAALELAILARFEGDRPREREVYRRILDQTGAAPELRPVRINLALLELQEGNLDRARRELEELLAGAPSRRASADEAEHALRSAYGVLLIAQGELKAAKAQFRRVLAGQRDHPAARSALAILDALEGQAGTAVGKLSATAEGELSAVSRANRGQMLWLAGRSQEAAGEFEEAAAAFPRWVLPRLRLGEAALLRGDAGAARSYLEEAQRLCRDDRNLLPPAGGAGVFQLPLAGARGEAQCQAVPRRLASALASGAAAELSGGQDERARRLSERVLSLPADPESLAVAYFVRGTTHLAGSRNSAAREDLAKALEGPLPSALSSLARNNLGVAHYRLDEVEAARRAFSSARAGSTSANLNLGVLLEEQDGDGAAALPLYQDYLRRGGVRAGEVRQWAEGLEGGPRP